MDGKKDEPLKDEASRRREWRGEERERARPGTGGEEEAVGHPGTIPPPD